MNAIKQYHDSTCITFVERTIEKHYVVFKQGKGCYTTLGCVYQGLQTLSLGRGCEPEGTVVHELGHVLGCRHEQSRSDRDSFITVYENNIIPAMLGQFNKTEEDEEILDTAYNTESIMHYGNYAFSKDPDNLKSMEALDGTPLLEPYEKPGLTQSDIDMINKLYKCP
ncbi:high choriolytic enzyme 1 [Caerostris extrusa]|uniref:Metalloendopeptidase n=1 Tax=Caerostris extrusa TaxID=172846 RepID=A0AAV4ST96_CAEEX|nr:high choriolytic enzyme 1 [Caerostris extrusa]